MTTYTWTDDVMQSGSTCDVDKVADNLMHLKYDTSGGVCKFNALGTISDDFTLTENYITTGDVSGDYDLTLPTVTDTEKQIVCVFDFTTTNASYPTITNTNLMWSDINSGTAPSFSTLSGARNVLTFKSVWIDSTLYWEAEYKTYGEFETVFSQPVISSNGTLGGDNFAVSATFTSNDGTSAYHASDNNSSTYFTGCFSSFTVWSYIWYNPDPLRVTSIDIENKVEVNRSIIAYTIYGSNDNNSWTTLTNGTNSVNAAYAHWTITIPTAVQGYYNYYKIYVSNGYIYSGFNQATLNGIYIAS